MYKSFRRRSARFFYRILVQTDSKHGCIVNLVSWIVLIILKSSPTPREQIDSIHAFFAGVELYLILLGPFVCPSLNFAQLIQDYIVDHMMGLVAYDREVVRKQVLYFLGVAQHILRYVRKKVIYRHGPRTVP